MCVLCVCVGVGGWFPLAFYLLWLLRVAIGCHGLPSMAVGYCELLLAFPCNGLASPCSLFLVFVSFVFYILCLYCGEGSEGGAREVRAMRPSYYPRFLYYMDRARDQPDR